MTLPSDLSRSADFDREPPSIFLGVVSLPFDKLRALSPSKGSNHSQAISWQAHSTNSWQAVYYVYILRCADGSFYVGSAQDLDARVKAHNDGRGAAYTFRHRPVGLVYSEAFPLEDEAVARERQLKRWTRAKKKALIAGDLERLKRLSKRRS